MRLLAPNIQSSRLNRRAGQKSGYWPNGAFDSGSAAILGQISTNDSAPTVGDSITLTWIDWGVYGAITATPDSLTVGDSTILEFVPVSLKYQWISGVDGSNLSGETANSTSVEITEVGQVLPKLRVTNTVSGQSVVFNPPAVTIAPAPPPVVQLVAATIKAATINGATSDPVDTTGATLLVVSTSWYNATTATPTISDSKGNTWTKLTTRTSYDQSVAIWYSLPSSVGSGHTVTLSGTSVFCPVAFSAYSGTDATPYVQDGYLFGGGTSMQLEIDPDSPDALVVLAISTVTNTSAVSINQSYTAQALTYVASNSIAHAQAYKIQSGQAVTDPTWSWADVATALGAYVVFRKDGGTKRVLVPVTSTSAYFSPYGWYSDGAAALQSNNIKSDATYAISSNPGNYVKTKFTGTSLRLSVDVAALRVQGFTSAQCPAFEVSVDGGAYTRKTPSISGDTVTVASGLSAGEHTIKIVFAGLSVTPTGRFTVPTNALKITGLKVDPAASLSAPTLKTKRTILFGDSISEGYNVLGSANTVADQNARLAWTTLLGDLLDSEFGVVGFASQGYTVAVSEIPDMEDAWDFYSDGKSRLVSGALPTCDYIVSGHGTNDGNGTTLQAAVTSLIGQWRTASAAKIFVLAPPNQNLKASISAGVTAAADGATYFIDTGTNHAGSNNTDGVHLNATGQANFANDSFTLMEPNI